MALDRDTIDRYLTAYGNSLAEFDADAATALWGLPGTIVNDEFAGSLSSRADMAAGLSQSYPLYRQLGLAGVTHQILESVALTDRLVRVRVRWSFLDSAGETLTTSDYEYLLREDPDGLHAYVAVGIDDIQKLRELADRLGVDLD
ncbi:hypothetical protein FCG67_24035 [Rhodococcus oryzae]|uniref:Nuclear transport factor 2 family protein n=1 Tax=Rhodococcus oryzae TaxID=2571143 RepID=A0ABY2RDI7_9NOCA|nr:hypothetical protein [Rhodococcus oryzae]TJZ73647.1 hypothetical protein FCG67_24035 [Rhodococcus oryzae]